MGKKLFIEGPVGIGKSSAIYRAVLPYIKNVEGFYVQRLVADGVCKAFRLNSLSCDEEYLLNARYSDGMDRVFLHEVNGNWVYNAEVFEDYGVRFLNQYGKNDVKLLVLDEIGGIELVCPKFKQELYRIMEGNIACIGVFKSGTNSAKMMRFVKAGEQYQHLREKFMDDLKNRWGAKLIEMNHENRREIEDYISKFIRKVMIYE